MDIVKISLNNPKFNIRLTIKMTRDPIYLFLSSPFLFLSRHIFSWLKNVCSNSELGHCLPKSKIHILWTTILALCPRTISDNHESFNRLLVNYTFDHFMLLCYSDLHMDNVFFAQKEPNICMQVSSMFYSLFHENSKVIHIL